LERESAAGFDQVLPALIQHSLDIIAIMGVDGSFRYVSPSIEQIMGRPAASFIGQNSFGLLHPDAQPASVWAWVLANPGQPVTRCHRSLHADGRWVFLESKIINLLSDPLIAGVVVCSRDISQRLEQERQMQSAYQDLEAQVQARTADVRRHHRILQELARDRRALEQDLESSYGRFTAAGAAALGVPRVGLWFYSGEDRNRIRCVDLYTARTGTHETIPEYYVDSESHELRLSDSERCVAIEDVTRHPRTRPFLENYHYPNQIRSVLAAHLIIDGRCLGHIIFEQQHEKRLWTIDEQNFAASLADLTGAFYTACRHVQTEKALQQSEVRFRAIFEKSTLGIAMTHLDGSIIQANKSFQNITGYSAEELAGLRIRQITPPEDLERELPLVQACREGKIDSYQLRKRIIRKDGSQPWIHLTLTFINPGEDAPQFYLGIVEDITRQQEAQERLLTYQEQLRAMTAELSRVEDRERQRIAGELHDRIGQCLALIKMRLAELCKAERGEKEAENLHQVCKLLDQSIADTRTLIFELSPPVLHLLGFEAALAWLADHTSNESGLKVRLRTDHQDKPLDEETRGLLFQSVREILFNVVKHAKARQALIDVRRQGDWLVVAVEDDGVGFNPETTARAKWPKGGFGLFHVRERLSLAGGRLEIQPNNKGGTVVRLYLPLTSEPVIEEVTDDAPADAGR